MMQLGFWSFLAMSNELVEQFYSFGGEFLILNITARVSFHLCQGCLPLKIDV